MTKIALTLCLSFVVAFLAVVYYDTYLHPDIRWFKKCASVSDDWAKELRKSCHSCYVFAGGSEIRTSIDPSQLMENYTLPAINAGAHAGFSSRCNAEVSMHYLKKGDTLVFSCLSNSDAQPLPASGLKFAWQRLGPHMFSDGLIPLNYQHVHSLMFGQCQHICTYLFRLVTRPNRIYRYDQETIIHTSGWMDIRMDWIKFSPSPTPISESPSVTLFDSSYILFLQELQEICHQKGVTLILMLPIEYAHESQRLSKAYKIAQLLEKGFVVLKDDRLGVDPDITHFSDTNLHMNAQGVKENMDIIGPALKNKSYWTKKGLKEKLFMLKMTNGLPSMIIGNK